MKRRQTTLEMFFSNLIKRRGSMSTADCEGENLQPSGNYVDDASPPPPANGAPQPLPIYGAPQPTDGGPNTSYMSSVEKERVARNRTFLKAILRGLEFCGRQGIPLVGHRDDSTKDPSIQGNLEALLVLFAGSGHQDLKQYLQLCKENGSCISETSQNELLLCMKEYIQKEIVKGIKSQKLGINYAVLAEGVPDVTDWDQLGLVLRFEKDGMPVEKLIEFIPCDSIKGEAISDKIKECLRELSLDPDDCRAQGYDGVINMAGMLKLNECAARFRQEVPRAIHYHCASHQLNLALSSTCQMTEIIWAVHVVKKVGLLFKFSPERQGEFQRAIQEVNKERSENGEPLICEKQVETLCDARWVEGHNFLEDFQQMFPAVIECLDMINSPTSQTESNLTWADRLLSDAYQLSDFLATTDFIAGFQTARFLFGFTKGLSQLLQGSTQDIVTAYEEMELVRNKLKAVRENVEEEFMPVYQDMLAMASLCGLDELTRPRTYGRSTQTRTNVEASSLVDYWRRSVFLPFLDFVIAELSSRFDQVTSSAVMGLTFIPSHLPKLTDELVSTVYDSFRSDLPSPQTFNHEVQMWKSKWEPLEEDCIPANLQDTLAATDDQVFPNICRILYLLLLSPVTTAPMERPNSTLEYIERPPRTSMEAERLNALTLLFVHEDIPLDHSAVIDIFAARNPERMLLVNPMC